MCYIGYFVKEGECKPVDVMCKTYDFMTGDCTSCYLGYALAGGKCLISLSIRLNNINSIDNTSKISTIPPISTSKSLNTVRDPNCIKYKAGTCIECSFGFYLSVNKLCLQLDPLCKTHNLSNG